MLLCMSPLLYASLNYPYYCALTMTEKTVA
jgi:hypothetical protein